MHLSNILTIALLLSLFVVDVHSQDDGVTKRTASLTLCTVKSNPTFFLNKTIEIDAVYFVGLEMGWLVDPCPCGQADDKLYAIQYMFDSKFDELTEKRLLRRFNKLLNKKLENGEPRKIRGVFTIMIEPFEKKNESDRRFEFQIRIMRLVSIAEVKVWR